MAKRIRSFQNQNCPPAFPQRHLQTAQEQPHFTKVRTEKTKVRIEKTVSTFVFSKLPTVGRKRATLFRPPQCVMRTRRCTPVKSPFPPPPASLTGWNTTGWTDQPTGKRLKDHGRASMKKRSRTGYYSSNCLNTSLHRSTCFRYRSTAIATASATKTMPASAICCTAAGWAARSQRCTKI